MLGRSSVELNLDLCLELVHLLIQFINYVILLQLELLKALSVVNLILVNSMQEDLSLSMIELDLLLAHLRELMLVSELGFDCIR